MRKASIIVLLVLLASAAFPQAYSLQFKSVHIFQLAGICNNTWGGTVATQTFTVPSGSVYKIESASATTMYDGTNRHYTSWNQAGISIDYNLLIAYSYSNNSYQVRTIQAEFPLWLPAGTYTLRLYDNSSSGLGTSYNLKGLVSAIEFELVTL